MDEKVSVIIPVYNSETYLVSCIECLLNQTYKNLELILIDDGSTDQSFQIMQNLQELHPEFVRIYHQENRGCGAARNQGILYAIGTYLMFVDNDDVMDPDYIEKMVHLISATESNMVVGGCTRVSESGKVIFTHPLKSDAWSKYRTTTPWSRIMRRDFILDHNLRFGEFSLGEDAYFTLCAYNASEKIVTTDYIGYYWVDHPTSYSNTAQKQITSDPFPMLDAYFQKNPVCKHIKEEELEYFIVKYLIWHLTHVVKTIPFSETTLLLDKYFSWLKERFPAFESNPFLGPNKPAGENVGIRLVVWLMVKLPTPWKLRLLKLYSLK